MCETPPSPHKTSKSSRLTSPVAPGETPGFPACGIRWGAEQSRRSGSHSPTQDQMIEFEGDPDELEAALKARYANADAFTEKAQDMLGEYKAELEDVISEDADHVSVLLDREDTPVAIDWEEGEQWGCPEVAEVLPLERLRLLAQSWSETHAPVAECLHIGCEEGEIDFGVQFA